MRQFSEKKPYLVLDEAAKKYRNIMNLRFGQRQIAVLSGYDVIHEALEIVRQFSDAFFRGQGPASPVNYFPRWWVEFCPERSVCNVVMPPRPQSAGGIERSGCPYVCTCIRLYLRPSADQVQIFVQGRISRP